MKVEPALTFRSKVKLCMGLVYAFIRHFQISRAHVSEPSRPSILYLLPERETFINSSFLLNYLHVSGNMSLIYLDTPRHPALNLTPLHIALNGNWSSLRAKRQ